MTNYRKTRLQSSISLDKHLTLPESSLYNSPKHVHLQKDLVKVSHCFRKNHTPLQKGRFLSSVSHMWDFRIPFLFFLNPKFIKKDKIRTTEPENENICFDIKLIQSKEYVVFTTLPTNIEFCWEIYLVLA